MRSAALRIQDEKAMKMVRAALQSFAHLKEQLIQISGPHGQACIGVQSFRKGDFIVLASAAQD